MSKNKRIRELALEIEFGMNKIDAINNMDKNSRVDFSELEQKCNDNQLKLEKAFFDKITNVNHNKID